MKNFYGGVSKKTFVNKTFDKTLSWKVTDPKHIRLLVFFSATHSEAVKEMNSICLLNVTIFLFAG